MTAGLSLGGRVLVVLAVGGLLLVMLATLAGGGWAGLALTGKFSGAIAGAGVALLLFVIVVWGFIFRDRATESAASRPSSLC